MPMLGEQYSDGTISVAAGSTAVTGTGVVWNDVVKGDELYIIGYGAFAIAEDVVDPFDDLELEVPFPGDGSSSPAGDLVAGTYIITRRSYKRYDSNELQRVVRELLARLEGRGTIISVDGDEPNVELGDDGDFAFKFNAAPWKLWTKAGGVWVLQGTPVGTTWRGAWSAATAYLINDNVSRLGNAYVANQAGTNQPPESSPTYWDLQAAKGDTGNDGGVVTAPLTFKTSTTIADPGSGALRLNQAVQKDATIIAVDLLSSAGVDFSSALQAMLASSSGVLGSVRLHLASNPNVKFLDFNITAVAAPGGFLQLTGVCTGFNPAFPSPFAADDAIVLNAVRTGDRGNTWFSGSGVPSDAAGIDGDYYLRTATSDVYVKAAGAWAVLVNLKGLTGTAGATWLTGAGVPSDLAGVNGDLYLRTATSDIYVKAGGIWGAVALNITGLTGARGFPGGAVALQFVVDADIITDSDPGLGKLRFSDNTQSASLRLRVSTTDALNAPIGPLLGSLADVSTSDVKATARLFVNGSVPAMHFEITSVEAKINYYNIDIDIKSSQAPDPFAHGATVILDWTAKGDHGDAATIAVGTVLTGEAGTDAVISNVGDEYDAVINFIIPRGDQGEPFSPVEVVALLADRDAFDDEPAFTGDIRLSVLVESDSSNSDLPTLYFKLSDTHADWSEGFTFEPAGVANAIEYDNATSGYAATNVQTAIDEAASNISDIPSPVAMAMIFGGA